MLKLSKDVVNTHGEINGEYRTGIFKLGFGGYKRDFRKSKRLVIINLYQHKFCEKIFRKKKDRSIGQMKSQKNTFFYLTLNPTFSW